MNRKMMLGLSAVWAVLPLAGCVSPPPVEVAVTADPAVGDDGAVHTTVGGLVNFSSITSGGVGSYHYTWSVSNQDELVSSPGASGSDFSWTFDTPGNYEVRVVVQDRDQRQANDSLKIVVAAAAQEPVTPVVQPLKFVDGAGFPSGGTTNPDGTISIGPGGVLTFNFTNAVSGGVSPYSFYLNGALQSGPIFTWVAPTVTTTTTFTLTIEIRDSAGHSIFRVITVVVVVTVVPPPNPVITVTCPTQVTNGFPFAISFTLKDGVVASCARSSSPTNASWDENDNWNGSARNFTCGTLGTQTFTLVIVCTSGQQVSTTFTCLVVPPATPPLTLVVTITAPADQQTFTVNQTVTFTVQIDGGVGPFMIHWSFYDGQNQFYPGIADRTFSVNEKLSIATTPNPGPNDWAQNAVQVTDSSNPARVSAVVFVRFRVQ